MKNRIKAAVAIAATAFLLWYALSGIDWAEVGAQIRRANPWLMAAAVLVSTLGMHVRALRWKTLLAPVDPRVPWRPRIAGVCIGFGANNVLPARLGEFARVYVLSRETRVPLTASLASLVLERVLDGIVCIGFLLGAMAMPGFPAITGDDPRAALSFIVAAIAGLTLAVIAMAAAPDWSLRVAERCSRVLPGRARGPVLRACEGFVRGLHVLRSPRLLAISVGWVLFQWTFLAFSFWLAFRSVGIEGPGFLGAVFLQSLIALAVSIPAAPGFFGPFEAASVWGLGLWGVAKEQAATFAIGFHLGGWLTVTALGLYYAARLNLRWSELSGRERKEEGAGAGDAAGGDARPA
ncbi:MAG TPA: lysylphosphatidylglycerol synthase transmembrane domain-containing protein [Longimicrobium sp.]|nr:lysylphosphatidylglycerol synthase transmembrane domain-containing protein [Longimicrobium sp.]